MTDIEEHASIKTELPPAVQRTIDAAAEHGWELGGPGLTFTVQFVKPSDPLALPVYASWAVGRSDSGKLSFRFQSSGTSGLQPLNSRDLIAYLQDPTVVYPDGMTNCATHGEHPSAIDDDECESMPPTMGERMGLVGAAPDSDAKAPGTESRPALAPQVPRASGLRVTIPRI